MYADRTLTPREAIRLCALGILAGGPQRYDDVVLAVRHFVSRMTGPSLELMGESIELLKYEGLAEGEPLTISSRGREVLSELLRANLRAGSGDTNELVIALKLRFLHLLPPDERRAQAELMIEACESELARLEDVRVDESGYLKDWLTIETERLTARIAFLRHMLAAGDPKLGAGDVRRIV